MSSGSILSAVPRQDEIDAIAAYVQAVNDLSVTPLFQEGQPEPVINYIEELDGSSTVEFHVPDPYVLRAASLPFRKIWMNKEPSYYHRVKSIFGKYLPQECHWYLKFMADQYELACKSKLSSELAAGKAGMPDDCSQAKEFVELALNSRLFHSGRSKNVGQYTADQFEGFRNEIGPARFEYMYAHAIFHVARQSTNLMEAAVFFLEEIDRLSKPPAVDEKKIEVPGLETFDDGTSIRRFSPGYSQVPATPGERMKVILREERYAILEGLLSYMSDNNEDLANAVVRATDFKSLLNFFGLSQSHDCLYLQVNQDSTEEEKRQLFPNVFMSIRKGEKIWCNDSDFAWGLLLDIREQILNREDWRPSRRPLWKLAQRQCCVEFPIRRVD